MDILPDYDQHHPFQFLQSEFDLKFMKKIAQFLYDIRIVLHSNFYLRQNKIILE